MASATDRELWQEPILQSAIRGLPVNCAAARFTKRGVERNWLVWDFNNFVRVQEIEKIVKNRAVIFVDRNTCIH